MTNLDEKIARFCAEYGLSPQQARVFHALARGALSNEALQTHLGRIARKTMTLSRAELVYLFFLGRRGE
jgi:DNA-binding CsgD family transcriptional regulator